MRNKKDNPEEVRESKTGNYYRPVASCLNCKYFYTTGDGSWCGELKGFADNIIGEGEKTACIYWVAK